MNILITVSNLTYLCFEETSTIPLLSPSIFDYIKTMKREIKFRVWHKPEKKMHYYLKAKFGKTTNITLEGKFNDVDHITTKTVPNDDLEVMQYTGQLDKNGNEVCEGDIVEVRHIEPKDPVNLGFKAKVYRVHVVWYDFSFSFERRREDGSVMSRSNGLEFESTYYKKNEIEIIGNIYENPDLLK
jgi:uncharacterized phage protein (TIGR01671 family)